ncbi:MAG: DUF4159 domain-containing protein, partial [Acetobacterales bacterium]
LSFAAPWLLVALAGLPLLWWLLRVTPPAPRLLRFPAIRLLFGLKEDEQTPARTPWWLILLRCTIAALVILGLAHPLWNAGDRFVSSGPVILVIDDGWGAARGWSDRQRAIDKVLARAERMERPIMVLTTAAPEDGGPIRPSRLMGAGDARALTQALQPKPWPVSRDEATAAFESAEFSEPANIYWIADGIENGGDGNAAAFARTLQRRGPVTVMRDAPGAGPVALVPPEAGDPQFALKLLRARAGGLNEYWVRGVDERGRILLRESVTFGSGATEAERTINLPTELRNRLTRLEAENVQSAAAVALIDERYRRRPVGIVSTAAGRAEAQPLLAEVFYLERALLPYAEIRKGTPEQLLSRPLAVLVVPDGAGLGEQARDAIAQWMEKGGTVLRFAGPRLAQSPDALSPVPLRRGDRTLGGAMSWAQPARLAPFEEGSPFAGIEVPDDVVVNRQVLAQPALDLPSRTWARLSDGTSLVTAADRGHGRIVLVHTTANTDWSNMALSGLYVQMLRRIVNLSQGIAGARAEALPPVSTLDGFGRLGDPPPAAQPLRQDAEAPATLVPAGADTTRLPVIPVSAANPPGLYGNESARVALNLATGMDRIPAISSLPAGIETLSLDAPGEFDFLPWLLAAALALLILDMWIGLILRGLAPAMWPLRGAAGDLPAARAAGIMLAAVVAAAALGTAQPARAQQSNAPPPEARLPVDPERAMRATFETRLAYVLTGDSRVDEISRAGLEGLSLMLRTRTSVEPKEPMAVDIETDEIAFFPFLYWPVTQNQPAPSAAARERLARFIASGGMILFDTRDRAFGVSDGAGTDAMSGPGAAKLREILRGLSIPPLIQAPKDHILTKAFYLLNDFPGRYAGGTLWVESQAGYANDGVSSIIIGANDFAGAWATDNAGSAMFAVTPGGSRQREMSYRFGVNVVMYALTGNYKSDQVHVPAILERLGQ